MKHAVVTGYPGCTGILAIKWVQLNGTRQNPKPISSFHWRQYRFEGTQKFRGCSSIDYVLEMLFVLTTHAGLLGGINRTARTQGDCTERIASLLPHGKGLELSGCVQVHIAFRLRCMLNVLTQKNCKDKFKRHFVGQLILSFLFQFFF